MLHITLPLMYYNLKLNNDLYDFFASNKDICIDSYYGTFPFCIWNGGSNLNIKNESFTLNAEIHDFFLQAKAPIRLDCSNLFITENDLYNGYQNLILDYGNNSGNFIEISDFGLLDYIQEKYQNYEFIFSKNAHLKAAFTEDIINTIIEQNMFFLIELPDQLKTNIEFLSNIKNKNKIEITIGNKCPLTCEYFTKCILEEQEYQINYSEKTIYYNCEQMNKYFDSFELNEEIEHFHKLGFTHFKVDTPPISKNPQFQHYLISNFIGDKNQLYFINK